MSKRKIDKPETIKQLTKKVSYGINQNSEHLENPNCINDNKADQKVCHVEQDLKLKVADLNNLAISIDRECKSKLETATVFVEGSNIYDVMLNQTNVQFNNNKFYLIQLLKDKEKVCYSVWMRWARVGKIGQMKLTEFGPNLNDAKIFFCKKFYEKTHNCWENRADFTKIDGKYGQVHIDYSRNDCAKEEGPKDEKKITAVITICRLDGKVQDLLKMIFDIKEMNSAATDLNYDCNKVPLGRLTESQIMAGYNALRKIESLLNEGCSSDQELVSACNVYYTRIPHDFGMKKPPLIRLPTDIKKELELLETLGDIKIALGLLKAEDGNVHQLDLQYQSLDCLIRPLSDQDETYQLLKSYLLTNHGSTHSDYKLEMLDLFEVKKETEWNNFNDLGNKMLLWHGSRTTNYGGILSQCLRIAPPEAPCTGYMFGKGVYFADMSSKSANYVYSSPSKKVGFLLLCEVSLGSSKELIEADSNASKLPSNMHSVKGRGLIEPDSSTWRQISDVIVPIGKPRDSGLSQNHKGYSLNYNEYIVYNTNQIRMRYMIKVRFHYK